jgi:hypothetical protein
MNEVGLQIPTFRAEPPMSEESKKTEPNPKEVQPVPPILSEEEQVRVILEQARQVVKQVVRKEREGEQINRELLNLRLR